jgi:phospholipid/cholesterol/gamma-HCH transport system ATP-binding protein
VIRLNQVCLTLQNRELLRDVTFEVSQRETLGIIGRSGSGKSLILKVIGGLLMPTHGTVELQSPRFSMLFQRNALFDSLTALENVMLPMTETLGRARGPAQVKARELLESVGLGNAIDQLPDELSGGMQKRLGIARTLALEPEIILYDEPTAGLDPITSKTIAELIVELKEKNGTTIIMVTNDLQRAYQICDRIGFVSSGSFRIGGSPEEIQNTTDAELRNFIYGKVEHDEHPL